LEIAKLLWDNFKICCKTEFIYSYRHLDVIQWLLSVCPELDVYAKRHLLLKCACYYNCITVVAWLVDNYYTSYPYIKFNNYTDFSYGIRDILINYNLINPSTLDEHDLNYYLQKTNGFVPQEFVNQYNKQVKIRGQHTKPALRE
jgi:hypothetical protein